MLELFWGCLAFGVLFSLVSVLLGDVVSQALDGALDFLSADYLNPTVLAGGITVFGGAGILLAGYTPLSSLIVVALALCVAVLAGVAIYRWYVRPMNRSENSTAYSIQGLAGKLGEVIVTIPEKGCGEVLMRVGAGHANHIASSFEGQVIQAGARVVVVEVKDGILYVSRFENKH